MARTQLFCIVAIGVSIFVAYNRDTFIYRDSPLPAGSFKATGVVFYDTWRTQEGYNLITNELESKVCSIFDMQGKLVHNFLPSPCHFFKDGSLFFMDLDGWAKLFSPDARELWSIQVRRHHDYDVSPDEKEIFLLVRNKDNVTNGTGEQDFVKGYSREDGHEIFSWTLSEHVEEFKAVAPLASVEWMGAMESFHLNSVQVLPPNPMEAQNEIFRHGNILVNCFLMQRTFIINRQTGKVVWQYLHKSSASEEETSGQEGKGAHTVKMLPNGHLFFLKNKNLLKFSETSFSSVEELNPVTEKVEWRYMANPATVFKTPLWGGAYQLPNGNALITNSTSGSAFEVTREGRLVWEWVNPARDEFGLPLPIYRVNRVSKQLADQIIKKWKEFE